MVELTIDDKEVEVREGATILDAATQLGIEIPTLCYHEGLTPVRSCRVCAVEIAGNGKTGITTACSYPVEAGLKVLTNTEKVKEARKLAIELMLATAPQSEVVQKLAEKLGVTAPAFTLKEGKCILCGLCVRACHEMVGADAVTFVARGRGRENEEAEVVHSSEKCVGCGSCAYVCPTKAITVEDVGDTRIITTPSGRLEFKLKKILIVDGDKCVGCQVCELICSMARSGEYNPRKSCIRVLKNREMSINIPTIDETCNYCGKCVDWCFNGAIRFVSFEEAFILRKEAKIGCFPAPVIAPRN